MPTERKRSKRPLREPVPKAIRDARTKRMSKRERESVVLALRQMEAEGYRVKPKRVKGKASHRAKKARRAARKCLGENGMGEPCGASCLPRKKIVEDVEVSGDWCMFHDPDLPQDYWKRNFQAIGTEASAARNHALRRPMELLAESINHSPQVLFEPHFRTLGLIWNADTQKVEPAYIKGKRKRGATHIGFSREGIAKKSAHRDEALQMRAADTILDRLYGKARVSMELGAGIGVGTVQIPQDTDRAMEVVNILHEVGAVPDEKPEKRGTGSKKAKK